MGGTGWGAGCPCGVSHGGEPVRVAGWQHTGRGGFREFHQPR